MEWIRISCRIGHDPKTVTLARRCGVTVPAAVGHVVMLLSQLPAHAADGDLASVPSEVVEHWAGWQGQTGAWDAAFRALFCDETGVVAAWERLNGAQLREIEKARARKAKWRAARRAGDSEDWDDDDDVDLPPVPSGRERHRERGHAGHVPGTSGTGNGDSRDMSPGHVPQKSRLSPVDVDVDVDRTTGLLLAAAARTREPEKIAAPPGGEPDGGRTCRLLAAAANRGITARFGEQPSPLLATAGTTQRALQALQEAGVPPDWAAGCIEQLAAELRADRPPRSLGYFVPGVVDRWKAEQAHRDAVALTPSGQPDAHAGRDPLYFSAVRYAREGDAEWIAYCDERGIRWQEAA